MKEILEKILEEVDPDIKEFMLADSKHAKEEGFYKNWEIAYEPNLYVLMWQELRDRRKGT